MWDLGDWWLSSITVATGASVDTGVVTVDTVGVECVGTVDTVVVVDTGEDTVTVGWGM